MALGRTVMLLVVVGAGAFAVMNPGVVKAFYQDLYPPDQAKRQALELCFMQDHKFNRLDSGERDGCYKRMLFPLGELSPSPGASAEQQPNVNLIDLQRSAAQGTLPRNDIRRLEQNQNASHSSR